MRLSFANLFRAGVLLILAAHVFYMYALGRTQQETFGFDFGATIIAGLFALAMLIPLIWAVTLPELPEIWQRHVRARHRYDRGRCVACDYPVTASAARACPECGRAIAPPRAYHVSARTIRLFIAFNLAAWMLGCAAAESWILLDEHHFRAEALAWQERTPTRAPMEVFIRPRAAPNGHAMLSFRPKSGFAAHE